MRNATMTFKIEVPQSVDNAINNLADEPTKSIGTIIKDAIYLRFGNISYNADKRRIYEKYGLLEFENRLKANISKIPTEKLIEPDFQTIMLAVDNLAPCIESETLRNLFAKLLARSCNSDYKSFIHPSFSGIIRQMSPFDAKILDFYVNTKPNRIITYTYKANDGNRFEQIPYTLDEYPDPNESDMVSLAISSLMRLGILAIHDDALVHSVKNTLFEKSQFYKLCEQERIKSNQYQTSSLTAQISVLTPFGNAFIHSCLE